MKICPTCKTENLDSAMFCLHCGERLPDETVDQPDAAYPEEEKVHPVDPNTDPSHPPAILPTSEGRPVVVPSLEEQVPPQTVAEAAREEPLPEELVGEEIPAEDDPEALKVDAPRSLERTMEEAEEYRKDMQAQTPLPPL